MIAVMADPRSETDATLALLDHWVLEVESTTAAIRAEIARIAVEGLGDDDDAAAHPDRER